MKSTPAPRFGNLRAWRPFVLSFVLGTLGVLCAPLASAAQNTLVVESRPRYQPAAYPDRIVLTLSDDPSATQSVSWRTDPSVADAIAEIAVAGDSPALHLKAHTIQGRTVALDSENGRAHHHSVTFTDLRPNTLYAYRVRGDGTWSEWFQFRTAMRTFAPFTFLYFGDAQNAVKSHFSRTLRRAILDRPDSRLMIHAGDLVNQRDGVHDDEWGEWFEAGGWLHGMIPSLPAPGNHEHLDLEDPEGNARRVLSPHWRAQFALPTHGPSGLEGTVYYVDFQGVRFITLNSTEAVYDDAPDRAADQARWLEGVLSNNPNRWTVVTFHHPVFSVALGRDNPPLQNHWKPVFDRYGVDLVLQGHDHTYGRAATNLGDGALGRDGGVGTTYVVSVSGPKMYFVSEEARNAMERVGEDTQLYQAIRVEWDRLVYESRTATGALYDAFELQKVENGSNRLVDLGPADPERFCGRPEIPGYSETRCWEGTDFVRFGGGSEDW